MPRLRPNPALLAILTTLFLPVLGTAKPLKTETISGQLLFLPFFLLGLWIFWECLKASFLSSWQARARLQMWVRHHEVHLLARQLLQVRASPHRAGQQHRHQHRHRRGVEDQRRHLQHHLRHLLQRRVERAEVERQPRVRSLLETGSQLQRSSHGAHEPRVHQGPLGPQHLHLQSKDVQSDRRTVKAGGAVD